jgi:hypothetical protein
MTVIIPTYITGSKFQHLQRTRHFLAISVYIYILTVALWCISQISMGWSGWSCLVHSKGAGWFDPLSNANFCQRIYIVDVRGRQDTWQNLCLNIVEKNIFLILYNFDNFKPCIFLIKRKQAKSNFKRLSVFIHYRNPGLCRVPGSLPRAALGEVLRSVKSLFTECGTLGTEKHLANTALPSGKHSAKMAFDKGPLAAIYSWQSSAFAEGRKPALGKADSLPSVKYLTLGKVYI